MDKGWVREGILSGLAAQPATVTELARRLGVSKSTASYHLSLLQGKGVVEVVDTDHANEKAQTKRFGLREGSFVTLLSRGDEEAELGRLRETFDLYALGWRRSASGMDGELFQVLLYRMFLHLFKISRSEHSRLLREYGALAGGTFASQVPGLPLKETLVALTAELARRGISDSDILELPGVPLSVLVSNTCIGSTFHPSNACYFLEGMIDGSIKARLGQSVKVERLVVQGFPSCMFAVGRVKRIDDEWLRDAVLRSSSYAAINRGRQKG